MNWQDMITDVHVYGLENAVQGAKYSFAVDAEKATTEITPTTLKLAQAPIGSGHDNFLNGILVQFDVTFTNKVWVEAERYHFLDFVSSQSTMHRITRFNLDEAYISYTDPRMIAIMKEKVALYNQLAEEAKQNPASENQKKLEELYLEILYSNPAGFRLRARMTTNYRQLKTIYHQRRTHRLPEWRAFCAWIETLPHAEFIIGSGDSHA
jgi:hypothetical protein